MGPKPRSTTPTEAEEAIAVGFRRRTLLPLDDMLAETRSVCRWVACARASPRSPAARCTAASCATASPGCPRPSASSKRKAFGETEIGCVHVDSAQLRSTEGIVSMVLATDRLSKFVHAEFHAAAEAATGAAFMRGVVRAFPCQIRRALTGNGVAFTKNASAKWDAMSGAPLARRATRPTACATNAASSTS